MRSRDLTLLGATLSLLGSSACQEYNLAALPGYLGKEFYAIDLNNYDGSAFPGGTTSDEAQFSVTVSNPNFSGGAATVRIKQMGGDAASTQETIAPGDLEIFDLPRWDAEDSFFGERAYFIESDVPVTAHQFNPANNSGVFSNDASLLIPVPSLGTRYRPAAWPQDDSGADTTQMTGMGDFITIIATENGTTVTVTPSTDVEAGDGVDAVQSGIPIVKEMNTGDVLQLQSNFVDMAPTDLTGSLIESDKPVAVFSGNECALIPGGVMACDHIEEQNFPVEFWGSHYVAVQFEPRKTESDVWRVIADEDGTTVDTDPPIGGFPATLTAGEYLQFEHAGDFELTSNAPVALVQYMTGSQYCGEDLNAIGDPAMLITLPADEFIDEYIFLTPDNYLEDHITIIAPAGTTAELDDEEIDGGSWVDVGDGDWIRARLAVQPGVHHLEADHDVGLVVYGYDDDVSYAYPGGAELTPLQQ